MFGMSGRPGKYTSPRREGSMAEGVGRSRARGAAGRRVALREWSGSNGPGRVGMESRASPAGGILFFKRWLPAAGISRSTVPR